MQALLQRSRSCEEPWSPVSRRETPDICQSYFCHISLQGSDKFQRIFIFLIYIFFFLSMIDAILYSFFNLWITFYSCSHGFKLGFVVLDRVLISMQKAWQGCSFTRNPKTLCTFDSLVHFYILVPNDSKEIYKILRQIYIFYLTQVWYE